MKQNNKISRKYKNIINDNHIDELLLINEQNNYENYHGNSKTNNTNNVNNKIEINEN